MPLKSGSDQATISSNFNELKSTGKYTRPQQIAIVLAKKRQSMGGGKPPPKVSY